jgi:hypothetical protein
MACVPQAPLATRAQIFCAPSSMVDAGVMASPRVGEERAALFDVGALQAHHQGHLEAELASWR